MVKRSVTIGAWYAVEAAIRHTNLMHEHEVDCSFFVIYIYLLDCTLLLSYESPYRCNSQFLATSVLILSIKMDVGTIFIDINK